MDAASLITQSSAASAQASYSAGLQARALAAQNAAGSTSPQDPRFAQKARQAAQQFEGFFVGQMMQYMMSGIHADATFGGGQAEETWRSLLNDEYGKQIAKSGRLGVTDMVMKAMLKAQEQHTAEQTGSAATATATPDAADEMALAAESQVASTAGSLATPKPARAQ